MAGKIAELAIRLSEEGASDAAHALDRVTSSAKDMGNATEAAGRQADKATSHLDTTAGAADEMASKGSQAAGAMAGLGDLIGGPFGGAMQAGGIGLQAMADSGDLLNAALENSVVASLRAKAATAAKTVVDKAQTVGTIALTVAQKALNVAMRANPIGLVITAALLLAGLFVLLYKRSDTFRNIVNKAMAVAKAGVDKVVKGFSALGPVVGKVMSFIGRVVGLYVKVYVTAFQLSFRAVKAVWDAISGAVKASVSKATDLVTGLKDKLVKGWKIIQDKGVAAFNAIISPVKDLIGWVDSLLDKIKSIHIPGSGLLSKIPGNPFGGGNTLMAAPATSTVVVPHSTITIPVTFTGSGTPADADAFMARIDQRLRALGKAPVFS